MGGELEVAYMTDGTKLLEVVTVESDGTVIACDCFDEMFIEMRQEELVGWRIVHPERARAA